MAFAVGELCAPPTAVDGAARRKQRRLHAEYELHRSQRHPAADERIAIIARRASVISLHDASNTSDTGR